MRAGVLALALLVAPTTHAKGRGGGGRASYGGRVARRARFRVSRRRCRQWFAHAGYKV
jgi:hypothetical protein